MGGRFPLMSVIRMKASDDEAKPLSGGGMDRVVERRGLSKPIKLGIAGALLLIAATGFYTMAPSADTQTIAADRQIGRAHVRTPVPTAQLLSRTLIGKKNKT